MRILVTNDDGILAPGIAALAEALQPLGEIEIVGPETGQRGAAHASTCVVPPSTKPWTDTYDRRTDPRGRAYFWLTDQGDREPEEHATDLSALRDGYITITPLQYDLTQYAQLQQLSARWAEPTDGRS